MARTEPLPELDPPAWPPGWRSDWDVRENAIPRPQAWHRTGICIVFEFEQIDEHGNWAWLVYGDVLAPCRLYELRAVMGEKAFEELWSVVERQARTLWHELGCRDFSFGVTSAGHSGPACTERNA